MGHGAAPAGLNRQTGLGAVERLDLGFFVDRQHHGMGRRVHVEADDVFDLLGESRIVGPFEGADAIAAAGGVFPRCAARCAATSRPPWPWRGSVQWVASPSGSLWVSAN